MSTYTHTTFAQAKTQLAELLGDSGKVFWTDTELGLYIKEVLRTWGLGTCYWKQTATFDTVSNQPFYNLMTAAVDGMGTAVQSSTLTDRDLITDICYALMEPPITAWASGWIGSEQFTLDQITKSLERSRDELNLLTGAVVSTRTYTLTGGQQRVELNQATLRVIRVTIQEVDNPSSQPLVLWEADEDQLQATAQAWEPQTGRPKSYSTTYVPNLSLDLWPPNNVQATLTVYAVEKGATFAPTSSATAIGLPDDFAWILKYMTLADILSSDGISSASSIAQYATQRVMEGLESIATYQSVLWAVPNQRRSPVSAVSTLDLHRPQWQATTGEPRTVHLLNWNLLAVNPVPNGVYGPVIEMVSKAIVPSADGDYIQVSTDLMPTLLSMAQHLAHVKIQGVEFLQTQPMLDGFNQRISEFRAAQASKGIFYPTLQWLAKSNRWAVPYKRSEVADISKERLQES